MKLAIILFNLGGPESLDHVEPFLRNLFSDRAIIALPKILRLPLARYLAKRRAPFARNIYRHIGGKSPILEHTNEQAKALEKVLNEQALPLGFSQSKVFIAMRCSKPFSRETVEAVKVFGADKIVLLPLYPQYSTTTSASSFDDWSDAAQAGSLCVSTARICCYPAEPGFINAVCAKIREVMGTIRCDISYRLLMSAHGLPKRVIRRGDPYQWQVEQSAQAIITALAMPKLDFAICYQSRVGPLPWLEPSTDEEIRRAGMEGKGVILAPIAFVSEHSETLVELDIEYAKLADACGVPDYRRVGTVGAHSDFIEGLARLASRAALGTAAMSAYNGPFCPNIYRCCGIGSKQ